MKWYCKELKEKYATFEGRISRTKYWKFYAITALFFLATVLIDLLIIAISDDAIYAGFLSLIYFAIMFLPLLAASVRRLHDTGKSGWYILINLIPLLGGIILLIMLLLPGMKSSNIYGPET